MQVCAGGCTRLQALQPSRGRSSGPLYRGVVPGGVRGCEPAVCLQQKIALCSATMHCVLKARASYKQSEGHGSPIIPSVGLQEVPAS